MPPDLFPSTHATWIDAQLTIASDADRAAAAGDGQCRDGTVNGNDLSTLLANWGPCGG